MKFLNLGSGAAHFKSPPAAIEKTIAALNHDETYYGENEGLPALRTALSDYYLQERQAKVPAENFLITAGTKQALFNFFSILLKPGDEVILPKPVWPGFTEILNLLQVKPVFLETVPEENYAISPEKLANLITPQTRLFVFSNPGNPTGRLYTKSEISAWLKVLENHPEITVLSDEIYDAIVYDQASFTSLLQFPDPLQKHAVVNGFSKNFGMSGWRLGYLVAPAPLFQKANLFQHVTISGVSPFIQEGALATLQTQAEFMPLRIKELASNRELLCNWLRSRNLFSGYKPSGTYYVFADLRELFKTPALNEKKLDTTEKLCGYLKQEYHLEFLPGEKFKTPGFIRITFAVPEADLQEALNRFGKFLEAYVLS